MEMIIATLQENADVDISKLRDHYSNSRIVSVPSEIVQSLCGFPLETLPPLGHHFAPSVTSSKILFDETLVRHCQDKNICIISCAGHPYWKLLLTREAIGLLKSTEKIQIADLTVRGDEKGDNQYDNEEEENQLWEISSVSSYDNTPKIKPSRQRGFLSESQDQFPQKPYFPIEGPSINIARLVARKRSISNPLSPAFVTSIGRIGRIHTRTKRTLRCEFMPPMPKTQKSNEMNVQESPHPWRSATRQVSMMVDLVFGKVFLQTIGTKQGERVIKSIQEGQLLQIEAKTNPGQRDSIEKWVDGNCLELTIMECNLLTLISEPVKDRDDSRNSNLGKSKKIETYSSLPTLTVEKVFDKPMSIKFVDNLNSILEFGNDVSKVISQPYSNENPKAVSPLVGIDCEWQPREFMRNPNLPQPVLLLQISFHELRTVYLLDLQTLLRPLRPPNEPMNDIEKELSCFMSQLMMSKRVIKVGYQLSSDLRRIFASYPHLLCFAEVHSALEISSLIKRVLHISKQKKSRSITMSLASMTSHYLGMVLDKGNRKEYTQTNWM
eukprot:CAMPEP_0197199244 /NCGR_PEP_ID=MMETSP1423-20130617/33785_1 /TAXON_ID=476441 /ORGANISM="Pseudo-nitzschia heimii, Strain UNC1101" /LENGTH=551 /DNA_ID=CAMNT_0042653099 /DNA_START=349 /DNA_END=2004 /DNA_ORIENTATION=+